MKKTLIIIGLILLTIGVSAGSYTLGTTITQTQYNDINFYQEDMNPTQYNVTINNGQLLFTIEYDTYQSRSGNTWETIQVQNTFSYDIERYNVCRKAGKQQQTCLTEMTTNVKNQWDYYKEDLKNYMENNKVDDYTGELNPQDLNIF